MASIRRARPDDAGALAELGARTFEDTFGSANRPEDMRAFLARTYGESQQRREIEDANVTTLVVEVDGPLIAFAQMHRGPAPPCVPRDAVEIARFYVDRPWQGRGVAHDLMQAVLDVAASERAPAIWLGVWQRNIRAIAFYARHGFRRAGTQPFLLGSDVQTDDIMWRGFGRLDHQPGLSSA